MRKAGYQKSLHEFSSKDDLRMEFRVY